MKKTHLLTKPTRVQDIDFDDMGDDSNTVTTARAERSRLRSYRRLRHGDL